ncbi:hypothetical protein C4D60_Mb08t30770 [Musa balbisiana]|uniref:Myb-like domain-containing protein n=1 Tax=Musa balbisiana TaxID=52838 RepID=A0A4S8K7Q0_MUSBA|nr:hypothetical protein C4D60_Mb08t30770 [Musa balbisiana]
MSSQGGFTEASSTASPDLSLQIGPPSIAPSAISDAGSGSRACVDLSLSSTMSSSEANIFQRFQGPPPFHESIMPLTGTPTLVDSRSLFNQMSSSSLSSSSSPTGCWSAIYSTTTYLHPHNGSHSSVSSYPWTPPLPTWIMGSSSDSFRCYHRLPCGVGSWEASQNLMRSRFLPRYPTKRSTRAPRMRWTRSLHTRFIRAVELLGGHERATPKSILELMDVKDLTLAHVKSHLQISQLQPLKLQLDSRAESGKGGDHKMSSQGGFTEASSTASPDLSLQIGPPSIAPSAISDAGSGSRACVDLSLSSTMSSSEANIFQRFQGPPPFHESIMPLTGTPTLVDSRSLFNQMSSSSLSSSSSPTGCWSAIYSTTTYLHPHNGSHSSVSSYPWTPPLPTWIMGSSSDSFRCYHRLPCGVGSWEASQNLMRSRFLPRYPTKRSTRAPRMRWTRSLHTRFIRAVELLGGHERATPKSILELMDVKDLTLAHVKSHLQHDSSGSNGTNDSYEEHRIPSLEFSLGRSDWYDKRPLC